LYYVAITRAQRRRIVVCVDAVAHPFVSKHVPKGATP
jgi:hypothetical protein